MAELLLLLFSFYFQLTKTNFLQMEKLHNRQKLITNPNSSQLKRK